jgi:CBS domain-containing protein
MKACDEVVHADHSLAEAHERIRQSGAPFLPVVDGDQIVGIVAAGDAVVSNELPPFPAERTAADSVSGDVVLVFESDTADMAIAMMEETGFDNIIVTDREKQLRGLLSRTMIKDTPGAINEASAPTRRQIEKRKFFARAKSGAGDSGQPDTYSVRPKVREAKWIPKHR